jgi:cobalt/nickel transport system ATP-binding protein
MEPSVLLLDEPTAGLDPAGVDEVLDVLERLRCAGTSIVMSTHDIDLAHAWADHVAVMASGSVIASGGRELLHDAELVERARLRLPSVFAVWRALPGALRPPRCPATVDELVSEMAEFAQQDGAPS